jgi:hypothetical protein
MQLKDTPPASPCNNEIMDYDELFEDDVVEVSDDEAAGGHNHVDADADDANDDDIGINIEGNENSEGNKPVRDDSAYVFSHHKG